MSSFVSRWVGVVVSVLAAQLCVGCVCAPGNVACGDQCIDVQADPLNCGGCGVVCRAGQVCYQSACTSGQPVVGNSCENDSQCDDSRFCNGPERCVGGGCRAGEAVDCRDPYSCTVERCDETIEACTSVPDDSLCATGQCRDFVPENATGCDGP